MVSMDVKTFEKLIKTENWLGCILEKSVGKMDAFFVHGVTAGKFTE